MMVQSTTAQTTAPQSRLAARRSACLAAARAERYAYCESARACRAGPGGGRAEKAVGPEGYLWWWGSGC